MRPTKQRKKSEETSTTTHSVQIFFAATVGISIIVAVSVLAVLAENGLLFSEYKVWLEAAATGLQAASGAAVALLTLTFVFNISITRVRKTFEKVYEVVVKHNPVIIDERTESGLAALLHGQIGDLQNRNDELKTENTKLGALNADLNRSIATKQSELRTARLEVERSERLAAEAASELQRISAKLKNQTQ